MGGLAYDQSVQRIPSHPRSIRPSDSHSARLERDSRSHHLLPHRAATGHIARVGFVRAFQAAPAKAARKPDTVTIEDVIAAQKAD
jgi:hypothetical protein